MTNFLEDVLTYFINEAFSIKANTNDEFSKGILQGYYETISHILNQIDAFGLRENISPRLRDFNPEDILV